MQDFLFDTPWWAFVMIGIVGVALFMSGNARQNKGALRAGVAVLLVGVLLAITSYLVDTPKEKVLKGTHALVTAAVDRDKATMNAELHPSATLAGWNRQQIIDGAATLADQFGLKSRDDHGDGCERGCAIEHHRHDPRDRAVSGKGSSIRQRPDRLATQLVGDAGWEMVAQANHANGER